MFFNSAVLTDYMREANMAIPKTRTENMNMNKFTIPARHIKAAMIFQAKGDVRYYLNGIHLNKEEGRIESTNGHCLITLGSDEIKEIPKSMIIHVSGTVPASAFYADVTMINDICGVIEFRNGKGDRVPSHGTRKRLFFDVIEGRYPDIEKVLPSGNLVKTDKIGFNPEYMGWAGKAASALGSPYCVAVAGLRGPNNSIEISIMGLYDEVKVFVMPCRF